MIRQLSKDEKIPYDLLLLADETIEAIDKYIFSCEIYVLEKYDNIVGVYALRAINSEEVEIVLVAVAKEYQGQGMGKKLLRDAAVRAKGKGFKTILIGTWDGATKQLCLYKKEGFKVYSIKKNYFVDKFTEPIYENGIQLKDMIMLKKDLK